MEVHRTVRGRVASFSRKPNILRGMMTTYVTLHFVLFLSVAGIQAQTSTQTEWPITVGEAIQNSLKPGDSHIYTMEPGSGRFVYGFVIQESVGVAVAVYNPNGKKAAEFDGPARGKISFQFDTEAEGQYRIGVTPSGQDEGDYSILVSVVEPVATDPAGRTDQLMAEYTGEDVPGVAVLVMKDGHIVFQKSYGMASLTYGIPMSDNTLHNIASTAKHFLTFGLLLLRDEGKLSLDDDVRTYIPELPDFGHTVKLRHLASHTSGYREYITLLAMTGRNLSTDLDIEEIIRTVQRQPELQNVPGSEFNYNNTGYTLLAEVIKRVSGTPFPQWMKENLFEPLEMHHTVVRTSLSQVVPNRSMGYSISGDGVYTEVTDLGGPPGDGQIHTTLGDLAKWIRNLNHPVIGTPELIEEMATPFELSDGNFTQYGLGLYIGDYKGLPNYNHGGRDLAHWSMMMVFPGIDGAVVTQSNLASYRFPVTDQVTDLFFGEYLEEEVKEEEAEFVYEPEKFDLLAGRYELPGNIFTFVRDAERIYLHPTGLPEVDLTATSDSTFYLAGVGYSITFHLNEDATADSLTLHLGGNQIAHKMTEFNLSPDAMAEVAGRYYSEEIETLYTVLLEEDNLYLRHYQADNDFVLTHGSEDRFYASFPLSSVASVEFVRDEEGRITGFKASNGRTRDVLFERQD
jgi:CubicO group peptidase (beta-lactamase class C family)